MLLIHVHIRCCWCINRKFHTQELLSSLPSLMFLRLRNTEQKHHFFKLPSTAPGTADPSENPTPYQGLPSLSYGLQAPVAPRCLPVAAPKCQPVSNPRASSSPQSRRSPWQWAVTTAVASSSCALCLGSYGSPTGTILQRTALSGPVTRLEMNRCRPN